MQKPCRPDGVDWILPYVIVSDVDKAVHFYENAFGFEKVQVVMGEDNTAWHAELKYKTHVVMFGKAGAYEKNTKPPHITGVESPINLYLYCEDVDSFYQNAIQHGAVSLSAPEDMFWHDRLCRLKDPDGYLWCFATYLGE